MKRLHSYGLIVGFLRLIKSVSNNRRQRNLKENSAKALKGNSGGRSRATTIKPKTF